MVKIIYIHGFLSSDQSKKAQRLKKFFSQNITDQIEWVNTCYPQQTVQESIQALETYCLHSDQQKLVVIGSSLGGFYAQYLAHEFGCNWVMINPALNPWELSNDYAGWHQNPVTKESVFLNEQYALDLKELEIRDLSRTQNSLLLLDEKDEVIDVDFAVRKYQVKPLHQTIVFPGGNHDFLHLEEAIPIIKDFLK